MYLENLINSKDIFSFSQDHQVLVLQKINLTSTKYKDSSLIGLPVFHIEDDVNNLFQ
jgi:hypothetical protein